MRASSWRTARSAALVLATVATSIRVEALEIVGYAGELGEWELTASVSGGADDVRSKYLSGRLTLRHVGIRPAPLTLWLR